MIRRPARNRLGVLDTRPRLLSVAEFRDLKPQDGDEVIVQVTSPHEARWHLRYEAADTSGYPWYFIGGNPLTSAVETNQAAATVAAWFDLGTVGPSITIPLNGDYFLDLTAQGYNGTSATQVAAGVAIGAGSPFCYGEVWTAGVLYVAQVTVSTTRVSAAVRGNEWRMRYYQSVANSNIRYRRFSITPHRLNQS